jgi:ABC-type amino acid transport substrate-binding protein
MGKILTLAFVLFAGWFADSVVPVSRYASFAVSGFFTFFGDPTIAIPFLLDLFQIPSDTYRFFLVVDNLVGARFGTLLAAMYTLVLAVLGASAVSGLLRIRWTALLRHAVLSVVLTAAVVFAMRLWFESPETRESQPGQAFAEIGLSRAYPPSRVHESLPPPLPHSPGESRVREIRERGFLRVGYFEEAMPFAFKNRSGKVVGFDVEMAHRLAQDLNVALELAPVDLREMADVLNAGHVDVIMSAVGLTLDRAQEVTLSIPYQDETLALVVKDHRREEFSRREKIKNLKPLRLGTLNTPYYVAKLREFLPQAELTFLDSPRDFFTAKGNNLDAFAYSAEAGSAWTLIYPAYTVAVPRPDLLSIPLSYAMARGDTELASFVNTWIELKKRDRTMSTLYDYWILGHTGAAGESRWSVIRDVLHWVD